MTKKLGSRLREKLITRQRHAEYHEALRMVETQPHLRARWASNGAFFLHPLYTMGFLLNPSPHGKRELEREDQIAHNEVFWMSHLQMATNIPLGGVACTIRQTKAVAMLFRYFAERIPAREKDKELKRARELRLSQSALISMKDCEASLETFSEDLEEPLLGIATALDGFVAENTPAIFWFDKRLLPEARRKVHEENSKGSSLARFLFSPSDYDWARMLRQEGRHPRRKIARAVDSRRKSYQEFLLRRKQEGDEGAKDPENT